MAAGGPLYAGAAATAAGPAVAAAAVVRLELLAEKGMPPAGSGAMVRLLVGGLNLYTQ
jgi:hypothetical protein